MLEVVSFVCGAAVMVLEMAGARVIAPHLGTSVVVWTAIIGVIMASLSLGYWLGGRAGDRAPSSGKLGVIILSGAIFVLIAALLHSPVLRMVASANLPLHISAIAATALLFAAPAVFLGMVSPYIIQVRLLDYKDKSHTGSIMGRFFALSTIGSIMGTFLGGYWLISWFGTRLILYAVAATLALAALMAAPRGRKTAACILIAVCAGLGSHTGLTASESLASGIDRDTRYNHLRIQEGSLRGKPMRFLITDPGSVQSGMLLDNPDTLALDYTRHYALAWHIRPDAKTHLMLGGGGYSVPKHILATMPEALVDVVEIDPDITAAAKQYFNLPDSPRLRVLHEDARVYLNRATAAYDVIMGDTFSSNYNIPFHLGTVESAKRIKALLNDDGVFACNVISAITGDQGQILRSIYHAFAAVFPQVHVFPVTLPNAPDENQNIMLVALNTPKPIPLSWNPAVQAMLAKEWKHPIPADIPPLTDNFAPVERYAMPLLQARHR